VPRWARPWHGSDAGLRRSDASPLTVGVVENAGRGMIRVEGQEPWVDLPASRLDHVTAWCKAAPWGQRMGRRDAPLNGMQGLVASDAGRERLQQLNGIRVGGVVEEIVS
jgi:hypothetical protein